MKFAMNPGPYYRAKKSTKYIMGVLSLALLVVWAAAIVYNYRLGSDYGLKSILLVVVALVATLVIDVIVALLRSKGKVTFNESVSFGVKFVAYVKYLSQYIVYSYSYVTALIFALTLPIGTPYYVVIIGAIVSTGIGKHVFGGFGNNIVNPAAVGRIFVSLSFGRTLVPYLASSDISGLVSGATPTSIIKDQFGWLLGGLPRSFTSLNELIVSGQLPFTNIWDLLIGNYGGALGETFTLLIIGLGIILIALKIIDWRYPVFYLGTVAVSAFVFGLVAGVNPFEYTLLHLALGGLAFGAVFMLTDPVTTPTTKYGSVLAAIIAGFLTFIIRVKGGYPEGVMFSIALVNIITPLINRSIKGQTIAHLGRKWGIVGGSLAFSMLISTAVAAYPQPDTVAPVLNVEQTSVNLEAGATYDLLEGVTATDDKDINVAIEVLSDGGFDANVPGTYTIVYVARDAANNETYKTRTIVVLAAGQPTHTVNLSGAYGTAMVFTVTSDGGVGEELTLEVNVNFEYEVISSVKVVSSDEGTAGDALLTTGAFFDKYIKLANGALSFADLNAFTFTSTDPDEAVNTEFDALIATSPETGKAVILALKAAAAKPAELGYLTTKMPKYVFTAKPDEGTLKVLDITVLSSFHNASQGDVCGDDHDLPCTDYIIEVKVDVTNKVITSASILQHSETPSYGGALLDGTNTLTSTFFGTDLNLGYDDLNSYEYFTTTEKLATEDFTAVKDMASGATRTARATVLALRAALDYAVRGGDIYE